AETRSSRRTWDGTRVVIWLTIFWTRSRCWLTRAASDGPSLLTESGDEITLLIVMRHEHGGSPRSRHFRVAQWVVRSSPIGLVRTRSVVGLGTGRGGTVVVWPTGCDDVSCRRRRRRRPT